jgi:hypothetical protein
MIPPELEFYFHRHSESEFSIAIRLRDEDNDADRRFEANSIRIDLPRFATRELLDDPPRYGLELGTALFDNVIVREAFDAATEIAARQGLSLRVRLCADQRSRDDLQRLRWELLRRPDPEAPGDPARAEWLITQPSLWFSRHLFSSDMRPVRLKRQAKLTALIAIANPDDVGDWEAGGRPLAPIDVDKELETARQGLRPLERKELVPGEGRVTLARLLGALREEPDIVYLACHGAIVDGEPRLMLEKDDGNAEMVSGSRLVLELAGLKSLPCLVVLISCQSGGGDGPGGAGSASILAGIGPRLAEAGVPAVLAMQGDLRMDTARAFLPPFFARLRGTGQVDAAVTAGRAAIRDAPDAWVPVLTTRLVEGRVWFSGGLTGAGDRGFAWRELIDQINLGKCVPILGSGLLEPFVGSSREIANRLAEANGYPVALSGREDLPQVSQFLKTMLNDTITRVEVTKEAVRALGMRWPELDLAPADPRDPGGDLLRKLTAAWRASLRDRRFEPHRYLAQMRPIRTIITTNPDDLLVEALNDAGRPPRVVSCRWDGLYEDGARPTRKGRLQPTDDAPDVYRLFGHLGDLGSLVLTEDDYFQFLTAVTRRQAQKKDVRRDDDLTDDLLRGTLASSALVFLGFRLTDWDFRSLFRVLIDQGGRNIRSRFTHIAVQIDPEDGTHSHAVQARNYIEGLFRELVSSHQSGRIAVYWGGAEDFIEDLDRQWQALQQPAPPPRTQPMATAL